MALFVDGPTRTRSRSSTSSTRRVRCWRPSPVRPVRSARGPATSPRSPTSCANRPEITDILRRGPGVAEQSRQLFASLDQSYPLLVSSLGVIARTQAVYLPNMRQIVTIYPRLIGSLITALNTGSVRYGANVTFALGINDRAPCGIGYLPKDEWRWPSEQNARELPSGMLCRVPQNSNIAVRGARSYPASVPRPACPPGRMPDRVQTRSGTNDAFRTSDVKIGPASVRGEVVPGIPSNATDEPSVYSTTYDPVSGISSDRTVKRTTRVPVSRSQEKRHYMAEPDQPDSESVTSSESANSTESVTSSGPGLLRESRTPSATRRCVPCAVHRCAGAPETAVDAGLRIRQPKPQRTPRKQRQMPRKRTPRKPIQVRPIQGTRRRDRTHPSLSARAVP